MHRNPAATRRPGPALAIVLLLCLAGAGGGHARALPERNPEPVAASRITDVVDGDTVVLETGAEVRLTGIQAPKLPLGRPGFREWPLAREALAAMRDIALGKAAALDYTGAKFDRWGRLLAHVRVEGSRADGVWLQLEMLRRGLARVYTFRDNRAHAEELYAAETEARKASRGIWALDWYRILAPGDTERRIGTFQIVEGTPLDVAIVRGTAYLNFGADWRTDFTASVASENMKLFRRARVDVTKLEGRKIRLRGWLVSRNGPMIVLTHPEQIEVLEP